MCCVILLLGFKPSIISNNFSGDLTLCHVAIWRIGDTLRNVYTLGIGDPMKTLVLGIAFALALPVLATTQTTATDGITNKLFPTCYPYIWSPRPRVGTKCGYNEVMVGIAELSPMKLLCSRIDIHCYGGTRLELKAEQAER